MPCSLATGRMNFRKTARSPARMAIPYHGSAQPAGLGRLWSVPSWLSESDRVGWIPTHQSSVEPDELDEQVRRYLEELGKLLGMYFTNGALRVDDVGYVASGFENRQKVGLLQTPLFHQIHQHFVRTRIAQRMMLHFVVLDKTNHQVKGGVLFSSTMLTLVHQLFDFGQRAFMLFVRGDHSRQDFRQYQIGRAH